MNIKALRDVILGRPIKFHVTPKTKQAGNYYGLVWPHIALLALSAIGFVVMGARVFVFGTAEAGAFIANSFWTLHNALSLSVIVRAAGRKESN